MEKGTLLAELEGARAHALEAGKLRGEVESLRVKALFALKSDDLAAAEKLVPVVRGASSGAPSTRGAAGAEKAALACTCPQAVQHLEKQLVALHEQLGQRDAAAADLKATNAKLTLQVRTLPQTATLGRRLKRTGTVVRAGATARGGTAPGKGACLPPAAAAAAVQVQELSGAVEREREATRAARADADEAQQDADSAQRNVRKLAQQVALLQQQVDAAARDARSAGEGGSAPASPLGSAGGAAAQQQPSTPSAAAALEAKVSASHRRSTHAAARLPRRCRRCF